jgi:hypothetical protein
MESAHADEHRTEPRSNIFVTATLYASGGSTPVRIRNMSRGGALVEAAALPPPGGTMRLSRGTLSVAGQIIWVLGAKAGLHFGAPIAVTDWLPNGQRGSGQQLIDEVVHQARLGAIAEPASLDPGPTKTPGTADDFNRYREMLDRAGEQLAADPSVAAAHLAALQLIDGVAQALAKLAAQAGESSPG